MKLLIWNFDKRTVIPCPYFSGLWVSLVIATFYIALAVIFHLLMTSYFGWNFLPSSIEEFFCDIVFLVMLFNGYLHYRSFRKQWVKKKRRKATGYKFLNNI